MNLVPEVGREGAGGREGGGGGRGEREGGRGGGRGEREGGRGEKEVGREGALGGSLCVVWVDTSFFFASGESYYVHCKLMNDMNFELLMN